MSVLSFQSCQSLLSVFIVEFQFFSLFHLPTPTPSSLSPLAAAAFKKFSMFFKEKVSFPSLPPNQRREEKIKRNV